VPPVQHLCKARSCAPTHACVALHLAAGCRGGPQRVARARRVASPLTGDAGGDAEGRSCSASLTTCRVQPGAPPTPGARHPHAVHHRPSP
jgi:hypothetical protein